MATTEDVQKLAALARITIQDADLETFTQEFDAILGYVGQLEKLDLPAEANETVSAVKNVMRVDSEPHEPGAYTEKIAAQFPDREGDALVVKQIISHA